MSNGDAQVKACVLCYHTAPVIRANPSQLRYSSNLSVPIRQLQIKPDGCTISFCHNVIHVVNNLTCSFLTL